MAAGMQRKILNLVTSMDARLRRVEEALSLQVGEQEAEAVQREARVCQQVTESN